MKMHGKAASGDLINFSKVSITFPAGIENLIAENIFNPTTLHRLPSDQERRRKWISDIRTIAHDVVSQFVVLRIDAVLTEGIVQGDVMILLT